VEHIQRPVSTMARFG